MIADEHGDSDGDNKASFVLWEGTKKHLLPWNVLDTEKGWMVSEINKVLENNRNVDNRV